jgi:protein-disulfide isomerase
MTIFLTLFFLTTYSQTGTITGFIYDGQVSNRLMHASVYIVEKKQGVTTDQNGVFKFSDLPKGLYSIRCSYVGNGDTTITNISVDNADTIGINLKTCPYVTFGGDAQCPACKKYDMTIPIKYGGTSKKDLAKAKKRELFLIAKPSHCRPRYFCKRDSTIYN